jgi:hypothetical protein
LRSWRSISVSVVMPSAAPAGEAHRGADLRRRQALALGQLGDERIGHRTPSSVLRTRPSRAPGGGDFSSRW